MSERKIVTAKRPKPEYTKATPASEVPPNYRAHEAYKEFLAGLRGEEATRSRKYISRTVRQMNPANNESLQAYLNRVGVEVKDMLSRPKSMSVSPQKPEKKLTPVAEDKPTKRKKKSASDSMKTSPVAKRTIKVVEVSDPFDDMMKLFGNMNMTKTTKRNAIAMRPSRTTSRQQAVSNASKMEKAKREEQAKRMKEAEEKRKERRKQRKEVRNEADALADLFSFKLGGGRK